MKRKVPVSLRLDLEVLGWLRGKGEGHLTRVRQGGRGTRPGDILTNLMEAERRAGKL